MKCVNIWENSILVLVKNDVIFMPRMKCLDQIIGQNVWRPDIKIKSHENADFLSYSRITVIYNDYNLYLWNVYKLQVPFDMLLTKGYKNYRYWRYILKQKLYNCHKQFHPNLEIIASDVSEHGNECVILYIYFKNIITCRGKMLIKYKKKT